VETQRKSSKQRGRHEPNRTRGLLRARIATHWEPTDVDRQQKNFPSAVTGCCQARLIARDVRKRSTKKVDFFEIATITKIDDAVSP
jgi:hypothetical protein